MRNAVCMLLLAAGLAACSPATDQADPTAAPAQAPAATAATAAPTTNDRTAAWWAQVEPDADRFMEHNGELAELFDDPYTMAADPTAASDLLAQLQTDVDALKDHGPVPIHSVDIPWGKALDAYADGYELIARGVTTMDTSLLMDGTTAINRGNAHLNAATEALAAYSLAV